MPPLIGAGWWRRWLGAPAVNSSAASADAAVAPVAGRYRLRDCIGRGAVGAVFRADDLQAGTIVAVKLVPLGSHLSPAERAEWQQRIAREAEAAARLRHPDIVQVRGAGVEPGRAWLAMDYVAGVDLSRYTRAARLLPEALVLRLGARVARALAQAHRNGIVHRDLKPANVLVDLPHDVLKIVDFGIARLQGAAQTRTGMTLGTPAYMAPELLLGDSAGPAADTYALGVMLFELFSGRRPREAATLGGLLQAVAAAPAPSLATVRPDLPAELVQAVDSALQQQPARRPVDLEAYAAELDRLALAWPQSAAAGA